MKNKLFKTIALGLTFTAALTFAGCKNDTTPTDDNNNNDDDKKTTEVSTYYVNYNGTGDGKTADNPISFEKISASAKAGDTLLLESGTYSYGYKIGLYNSGSRYATNCKSYM